MGPGQEARHAQHDEERAVQPARESVRRLREVSAASETRVLLRFLRPRHRLSVSDRPGPPPIRRAPGQLPADRRVPAARGRSGDGRHLHVADWMGPAAGDGLGLPVRHERAARHAGLTGLLLLLGRHHGARLAADDPRALQERSRPRNQLAERGAVDRAGRDSRLRHLAALVVGRVLVRARRAAALQQDDAEVRADHGCRPAGVRELSNRSGEQTLGPSGHDHASELVGGVRSAGEGSESVRPRKRRSISVRRGQRKVRRGRQQLSGLEARRRAEEGVSGDLAQGPRVHHPIDCQPHVPRVSVKRRAAGRCRGSKRVDPRDSRLRVDGPARRRAPVAGDSDGGAVRRQHGVDLPRLLHDRALQRRQSGVPGPAGGGNVRSDWLLPAAEHPVRAAEAACAGDVAAHAPAPMVHRRRRRRAGADRGDSQRAARSCVPQPSGVCRRVVSAGGAGAGARRRARREDSSAAAGRAPAAAGYAADQPRRRRCRADNRSAHVSEASLGAERPRQRLEIRPRSGHHVCAEGATGVVALRAFRARLHGGTGQGLRRRGSVDVVGTRARVSPQAGGSGGAREGRSGVPGEIRAARAGPRIASGQLVRLQGAGGWRRGLSGPTDPRT